MAKTTKPTQDVDFCAIPWNRLVLSEKNVRKVGADKVDPDFMADIRQRGVLQNLVVHPKHDTDGAETGYFEVIAGGRRYTTVGALIALGDLPETHPLPCQIRRTGIAEDDSLAENVQRAPLHPLDQYRAFASLIESGLSEDEVAARHFVSVTVVRQRLKMATVSPNILEAFGRDELRLEQLMAFTVNPNHERQEQVWAAIAQSTYGREPYHIRRLLTEDTVKASDKRALFVGTEAYVEAGGTIARDLFESDDGGWLQEPALLERLVREKLEAAGAEVKAEGWLWVELAVDHGYGHTDDLRVLVSTDVDLSDDEKAELVSLLETFDALSAQYDATDELPHDVDKQLGLLEDQIDALQNRPAQFDPEDLARGGAFISLDRYGHLRIERGYVRPEDEPAPEIEGGGDDDGLADESSAYGDGSPGDGPSAPEEDEGDDLKPLSDRLLSDLTAYRTIALRDAVANNPTVAMTLLLHKLCGDQFYRADGACLEARIFAVSLIPYAGLSDSEPAEANIARNRTWLERLPDQSEDLWDWLAASDEPTRQSLLAHCVSFGVNGIYQKADRYGGSGPSARNVQLRLSNADRLAQAVDLDIIATGWRPTAHNYFGQISKAHIRAAVMEAKGADAERRISGMKKTDMATEAENLLADTGWLPEVLRTTRAQAETTDDGTPQPTDGEPEHNASASGEALQAAE